jgi:hypothetical protein
MNSGEKLGAAFHGLNSRKTSAFLALVTLTLYAPTQAAAECNNHSTGGGSHQVSTQTTTSVTHTGSIGGGCPTSSTLGTTTTSGTAHSSTLGAMTASRTSHVHATDGPRAPPRLKR